MNADIISFRWKQAMEYSISNFENAIKDINWLLTENKEKDDTIQSLREVIHHYEILIDDLRKN